MSIDPQAEVRYRHRLALQHLNRAERMYRVGDWPLTVHFAQLAIENFAKAIVAVFEVPTWSHDPSSQLIRLCNRFPKHLARDVRELADMAREVAPEHGRSTYGDPTRGLMPNEIYRERHALEIILKARKAKSMAEKILGEMDVLT